MGMDFPTSLPEPPPPLPGSELEQEPEAEDKRSRGPVIAAIAVLACLVAVVVGVATWLAAPGRCDGTTFTSSRFAYCLTTPVGWQSQEVDQQGQAYDSFLQQNGSAAVLVSANSIPRGTTLQEIVDGFRSGAEQQGLVLEESTSLTIDGVPAVQFDAQLEDQQGNPVAFRIVLMSRDGTYWAVRLQDTPEQFAGHTNDFRAMLQSWRFI
jgi:hypothetical protein